jgi:hypothetical protein
MSTPPQEHTTPHASSPLPTPHGAAQTVLSFLGNAAAREAREVQAEASAAVPTVLGTAQNMLSRRASSSMPHATSTPLVAPTPQQQHFPGIYREHATEAPVPLEVPLRAAERSAQGRAASVSSHSGGSGRVRPITPPQGVASITRSNPALPEATHQPRLTRAAHSGGQRRLILPFADSETVWHYEDKDPVRSPPMISSPVMSR